MYAVKLQAPESMLGEHTTGGNFVNHYSLKCVLKSVKNFKITSSEALCPLVKSRCVLEGRLAPGSSAPLLKFSVKLSGAQPPFITIKDSI